MGAIVSLLVSMFAAIGAYGYVWTHCESVQCMTRDNDFFQLPDLIFAAVGASFILLVMSYICMYQGTSQRLEQFITYKIRDKYRIQVFFPEGYDPYCKKGLNVVQGLYGEFVKIFFFVMLVVAASFCLKLYELQGMQCDIYSLLKVVIGVFVYLILDILFLFENIRRYQKRCQSCPHSKNEKNIETNSRSDYAPFNCCIMNATYDLYEKICLVWEKCKCAQE